MSLTMDSTFTEKSFFGELDSYKYFIKTSSSHLFLSSLV